MKRRFFDDGAEVTFYEDNELPQLVEDICSPKIHVCWDGEIITKQVAKSLVKEGDGRAIIDTCIPLKELNGKDSSEILIYTIESVFGYVPEAEDIHIISCQPLGVVFEPVKSLHWRFVIR